MLLSEIDLLGVRWVDQAHSHANISPQFRQSSTIDCELI
jgi:hypothetical protein